MPATSACTPLATLSAGVVLSHHDGQGHADATELTRLRLLLFQRIAEASARFV